MDFNMKKKLLVIVGPTASGKTSLSVEVAKHYNGEVISADSMQIYRGMQIATAKPTYEEMDGIKHHLIDFLDLSESYSVGKYVEDAKRAVDIVLSKGKIPIICGGTGLYVDSLLNGINFTENSADPKIRAELNKLADEKGTDYLLDILSEFDLDSAKRLKEQKNLKRIIRAIEFYKTTGITITKQNEKSRIKASEYDCLIFGLTAKDRQYIYNRINKRVDNMIENGLLEEAKTILNSNLSETSSKAIGYKQLELYFKNEMPLEECIEKLKTETRHYAKRQLTWFRRNKDINWINIDELKTTGEQLKFVKDVVKNRGFLNG